MKFLSLLFAALMLALSCLPCICDENCAEAKTEHSTSNNKQKDENCASICGCSCCNLVVNNLKPVIVTKKISAVSNRLIFIHADQDFTSYNFHNIWQPPQLG